MGLKKPEKTVGKGEHGLYFLDTALRASHPTLHDAMADTAYEDGSDKGEGYVTVRPMNGRLAGTLRIANSGLMLRSDGASLSELFDSLEALLVSPTTPWENDKFNPPRGPKGKKK